jgi:hypothetical protein
MSRTILICSLLFLASACRNRSEVKEQLPRQVDLFVRYLEPEQHYRVEALLLEGEPAAARSLTFSRGVRFGDKELRLHAINELNRYEMEYNGAYHANSTFAFQDETGKKFRQALDMAPIGDFRAAFSPEVSSLILLELLNQELKNNETLTAILTDAKGQSGSLTIEGLSGKGPFELSFTSFGPLSSGPAELYLVKKMSSAERIDQYDLVLHAELYSKTATLVLP